MFSQLLPVRKTFRHRDYHYPSLTVTPPIDISPLGAVEVSGQPLLDIGFVFLVNSTLGHIVNDRYYRGRLFIAKSNG